MTRESRILFNFQHMTDFTCTRLLEDLHSNRTSARRSIQEAEDVLQNDLAEMSALVPVISKHVENLRSSKVHSDQIVQNERSRFV